MTIPTRTSTGDNDPKMALPSSDHACTQCKGSGFLVVAPPHPDIPYMLTIPFVQGECGVCFGTGSGDLQRLHLKEPGSDFMYLQFMAPNWKGTAATKQDIKSLEAQVAHWEEKSENPTQQGLSEVFQGLGMNAEQAGQASQAAAGYAGLKEK